MASAAVGPHDFLIISPVCHLKFLSDSSAKLCKQAESLMRATDHYSTKTIATS